MGSLISSSLNYNGFTVANRGDMLSLTDMWKAAKAKAEAEGKDATDFESRRPSEWLRSKSARIFIEHMQIVMGNSHSVLIKTENGGKKAGGSTFAHWQIGLAYAKYLSPEFHMWCNTVVRQHMEGRQPTAMPDDIMELIRRDDGMIRMLSHKVTELEKALPAIATEIATNMLPVMLKAHMAEHNYLLRHGKTAGEIWRGHNLPRLKGAGAWLGNRLKEMGCTIEHNGRADIGGRAVRLFDPDKAAVCMKNGLLHTSQAYAAERMGQGKLRLIRG